MNNVKKLWWIESGSAFTPSNLNPLMWFDSTDMASDGSYWNDNMGTYDVTAAGTARPTYTPNALNGYPSFVFDGTTDVLTRARVNAMQGLSGITLWAVLKRGVFAHDDGASASFITGITHFSDNNIYCNIRNGGLTFGSFAHSNNFNYSVMVFDGSLATNINRLKLWVNGVQRTLSFTGTIPTTTENSTSTLQFGRAAASFTAGEIVEVGVVASALSSDNITLLNTYLASRYGL
jgi:hypothetical protein